MLPLHYKYNPKLKAKILNAKNEFDRPDDQGARMLARYLMDQKKLSDYSMRRSRKNYENRYDKPEYTTEKAKHFKDWKRKMELEREHYENRDHFDAETFLNNRIQANEIKPITKQLIKKKINKHIVERNLGKKIKGDEWDELSKQDREDRIKNLEIFTNPVSVRQKKINDLIIAYQNTHQDLSDFNTELRQRTSQPGLEFFKLNNVNN